METVLVNLKREVDESYPILIEPGLIRKVPEIIGREYSGRRCAIITDSNVRKLYGEDMLDGFKAEGIDSCLIDFPAGERSKNRDTANYIRDELLERKYEKDCWGILLGGGAVGDTGGYAAGTVKRGILVAVPGTTSTSQIDSSIGGKWAVNTIHGKNTEGIIYQPKVVFIDPEASALQARLAKRDYTGGIAEMVKHGIIGNNRGNREFFDFMNRNKEGIKEADVKTMTHALKDSCNIKAWIVGRDPQETNERSGFNLGHTLGQNGPERMDNYSRFNHGESVSIGMNFAGRLAVKLGYWNEDELEEQNQLLEYFGLPIHCNLDPEETLAAIHQDKKARKGVVNFVFPKKIGELATTDEGQYRIPVSDKTILETLKEFQEYSSKKK